MDKDVRFSGSTVFQCCVMAANSTLPTLVTVVLFSYGNQRATHAL